MKLPPLPQEEGTYWETNQHGHSELVTGHNYTAQQMLEYAEAACDALQAKLRTELDEMLFLLEAAESSLSDYQQDVPFHLFDALTLRELRAALQARGII